jgi:hypothetical protein
MFVYGHLLLLSIALASCTSGFQTSSTRTRVVDQKSSLPRLHPNSIPAKHNILLSNNSDDEEPETIFKENSKPSLQETNEKSTTVRDATFSIFKLFSYCIQFLGAFFFLGLILNFVGYGYTVDLEHGLVIDRIENIRNEIQFEREIERETMQGSKYLFAPKVPE